MDYDHAGQPTKYDPEFHPKDLLEKAKDGAHWYEVAADWNVCRATVYNWANAHPEFLDAMVKAKELMESWYLKVGRAATAGVEFKDRKTGEARKIDFKFFKWMSQNNLKWSDRIETNDVRDPKQQEESVKYVSSWGDDDEENTDEALEALPAPPSPTGDSQE